jgi:DNA helicase HerA-like ATPase
MKLPTLKNYIPIDNKANLNKYDLIPDWPFRLLICGSSGSGKTNLLLNFILQYLSYDRLIIYAKDLMESKYEFLQKLFQDESEAEFTSDDNIISVDHLDPNYQTLIVFDDFLNLREQTAIENLFIRGRKKNVSVIYLTQSYYKTPKNIRLQCNYLVLFPTANQREINSILKDYSLPEENVKQKYLAATQKPFDFFMFDFKNPEKKYRHNFKPI